MPAPTSASLRDRLGQPGDAARDKKIDHLDDACLKILAASPFAVLATSGADGSCDASPRGGPPGFIRALSPHRIALGELPGNRLFDGAGNLAENPHAALLVLVPGVAETLRIEGRAELSTNPETCAATAVNGKEPWGAVVIDVAWAFVHCGKALKRSQLWQPESWPAAADRPRMAAALAEHIAVNRHEGPSPTVEDIETDLDETYRARLW